MLGKKKIEKEEKEKAYEDSDEVQR